MNTNKIAFSDSTSPQLSARLASTQAEIRQAQRLRYDIFTEEFGANLSTSEPGLDQDDYDPYCKHMLIVDERSDQIVGYTRLLSQEHVSAVGGFYSQQEFDLGRILDINGRFLEIGRTCIHPGYRTGGAIAVLWSALARHVQSSGHNYLIGCASIPVADDLSEAQYIMNRLKPQQILDPNLGVRAKDRLPMDGLSPDRVASIPPLLKAYLRLGAMVSGEAHWDRRFNSADVFILLSMQKVTPRYERHFLKAA
jgi:putative hemolysin